MDDLQDLHFDDDKLDYISENLSKFDLTRLDLLLKQVRFDTTKIELLQLLDSKILKLSDQDILKAVAELRIDHHKLRGVEILYPKVEKISFMVYKILAGNIKLQARRLDLFKLWKLDFNQEELLELLGLAESDEGMLSYLEYFRSEFNFQIEDRLLGKFFESDENYFKVAQEKEFVPSNSRLSFVIFGEKLTGNNLPIGRKIRLDKPGWKIYLSRTLRSVEVVCVNSEDQSRIKRSYTDEGVIEIKHDDSSGRTVSLSDPS